MAIAPRSGSMIAGTIGVTGIAGDTARQWSFPTPAYPVTLNNGSAVSAYVRINDPDNPAVLLAFTLEVPTLTSVDLSQGGRLRITDVSAWIAAGSYATIDVGGCL